MNAPRGMESFLSWGFKLTHEDTTGVSLNMMNCEDAWHTESISLSERIFLVQPDIQAFCCPLAKGFSEEGEA